MVLFIFSLRIFIISFSSSLLRLMVYFLHGLNWYHNDKDFYYLLESIYHGSCHFLIQLNGYIVIIFFISSLNSFDLVLIISVTFTCSLEIISDSLKSAYPSIMTISFSASFKIFIIPM